MLPRVEQKDKQLLPNKWQTTITTQGLQYFTFINSPYLGWEKEDKLCEMKN